MSQNLFGEQVKYKIEIVDLAGKVSEDRTERQSDAPKQLRGYAPKIPLLEPAIPVQPQPVANQKEPLNQHINYITADITDNVVDRDIDVNQADIEPEVIYVEKKHIQKARDELKIDIPDESTDKTPEPAPEKSDEKSEKSGDETTEPVPPKNKFPPFRSDRIKFLLGIGLFSLIFKK